MCGTKTELQVLQNLNLNRFWLKLEVFRLILSDMMNSQITNLAAGVVNFSGGNKTASLAAQFVFNHT